MSRLSLACLTVFVVLLCWRLVPDPYQAWLLMPVWVVASWLYFTSSFESALQRRRTWLEQYLLVESPGHRLLRGGLLLAGCHLLVAALLCLFLLVALRRLDPLLWLMLLAGVPVVLALNAGLRRRLARHVKAEALPVLTRRFVVPLGAGLLLLVYLAIQLLLPQPDLRGMSWQQAVPAQLPSQVSGVAIVGLLERLHALLELTLQWALQNTLGDYAHGGLLGLAGWSLLLLTSAAFVWAYVRILAGVVTQFDKRGDPS